LQCIDMIRKSALQGIFPDLFPYFFCKNVPPFLSLDCLSYSSDWINSVATIIGYINVLLILYFLIYNNDLSLNNNSKLYIYIYVYIDIAYLYQFI
jgi:hypothetical protein